MPTAMESYRAQETEARFLARVTDLAQLQGWKWMHIRPGLNERGRYRTPVAGPLGAGWPDLVLVRNTRLIFAELKAERGRITPLQESVLWVLGGLPQVEVFIWRPRDWETIERVLA